MSSLEDRVGKREKAGTPSLEADVMKALDAAASAGAVAKKAKEASIKS
jgi:hypothetical protein